MKTPAEAIVAQLMVKSLSSMLKKKGKDLFANIAGGHSQTARI